MQAVVARREADEAAITGNIYHSFTRAGLLKRLDRADLKTTGKRQVKTDCTISCTTRVSSAGRRRIGQLMRPASKGQRDARISTRRPRPARTSLNSLAKQPWFDQQGVKGTMTVTKDTFQTHLSAS